MSKSKKTKKILFLSDNIAGSTGNSKVARELLKGLKVLGYNVANVGLGQDEPEYEFEGVRVLPITQYGFDESSVGIFLSKLSKYLDRENPDYLIILGDRIHFQNLGIGNLNKEMLNKKGTKIIFWETVDSNNLLCMESSLNHPYNPKIQIYNACNYIVTTSEYGKKILENEFVKVDKVIWEFADTEKYQIVSDKKKNEIRDKYGFMYNDFIFLVVGRCMRRKNHELVFEALYPLLIEYPLVRLFCLIPDYNKNDEGNLIDFVDRVLARKYGGRNMIDEQKILFVTHNQQSLKIAQGIDEDEVIDFYNLSDATISGSSNEGFNLVFGETMAVGNSYVGIDNTTMPELTEGKVGFIAKGSQELHVGQSMKITTTTAKELREQAEKVIELWPGTKPKEMTEEYKKKNSEWNNLKESNRKFIEAKIPKGKMISEWHKYLKSLEVE